MFGPGSVFRVLLVGLEGSAVLKGWRRGRPGALGFETCACAGWGLESGGCWTMLQGVDPEDGLGERVFAHYRST